MAAWVVLRFAHNMCLSTVCYVDLCANLVVFGNVKFCSTCFYCCVDPFLLKEISSFPALFLLRGSCSPRKFLFMFSVAPNFVYTEKCLLYNPHYSISYDRSDFSWMERRMSWVVVKHQHELILRRLSAMCFILTEHERYDTMPSP